MTTIDYYAIKQELVVFLRNQDVMTISERNVTTENYVFSPDGSNKEFTIVRSNLKNVRTVTADSVELTFGTDYTVDYATQKVTLTVAPTTKLNMDYDYGTDKIFPDFPKNTLKISNFPRISVDLISVDTVPGGFGNVLKNRITFTVVVYSGQKKELADYLTSVRSVFISEWTSFYYLKHVIRPIATGPVIKINYERGKDKIMSQNIDFEVLFNYEKN